MLDFVKSDTAKKTVTKKDVHDAVARALGVVDCAFRAELIAAAGPLAARNLDHAMRLIRAALKAKQAASASAGDIRLTLDAYSDFLRPYSENDYFEPGDKSASVLCAAASRLRPCAERLKSILHASEADRAGAVARAGAVISACARVPTESFVDDRAKSRIC